MINSVIIRDHAVFIRVLSIGKGSYKNSDIINTVEEIKYEQNTAGGFGCNNVCLRDIL